MVSIIPFCHKMFLWGNLKSFSLLTVLVFVGFYNIWTWIPIQSEQWDTKGNCTNFIKWSISVKSLLRFTFQ